MTTRTRARGCFVGFVAVLLPLTLASPANAAPLEISGKAVTVGADRVAAVGLTNNTRQALAGKLALKVDGEALGKKAFFVPKRSTRKVGVKLGENPYAWLELLGAFRVKAVAKPAGKKAVERSLKLKSAGGTPDSGGGGGGGGEDVGGGGGGGGGEDVGGGGGGGDVPLWRDGRWQGDYPDESVNLAFNVVGTRLYTGPFDDFYSYAQCTNTDPEYAGPQTWTESGIVSPVEATIGPDGQFSGTGVFRPLPNVAKYWTLTGRISGQSITDGELSIAYNDTLGNPCSGVRRFTAVWYGDFTL